MSPGLWSVSSTSVARICQGGRPVFTISKPWKSCLPSSLRKSEGWSCQPVGRGPIAKYLDLPLANYATLPYDKVLKNGKTIGLSTYTGYTFNERAMISLAMVDVAHSVPGTEVSLIWGEEGGGSPKPTVERHAQAEIRATVAAAPYAEVARVAYRPH